MDLEGFIKQSKETHGDKYDYSKSVYKNSNEKLIVTCPKHGDFEIVARYHYGNKGIGCRGCAGNTRITTEQFIEDSIKVHGDRYSYENTNYINGDTKVDIICKTHGPFQQLPRDHKRGRGCARCKKVRKDII